MKVQTDVKAGLLGLCIDIDIKISLGGGSRCKPSGGGSPYHPPSC